MTSGVRGALPAVVAVCAVLSVAAFLAEVYDILSMPFTLSAISIPGALTIVGISVWAGRTHRTRFLRTIWVGLIAGFAGLAAYDVLRAIIALAVPFDPFRAHRNFGALMLRVPPAATPALVAGWAYHVWNGISFAVAYTVIAGGRRWVYGLAWAMALEIATIVVYPRAFPLSRTDAAFISVSLLGHAAYGTTLGVLSRSWLGPGTEGGASALALPRPSWRRVFS